MDSTDDTHDQFMYRCLTLAERGLGRVRSNPMVGSLIVHDGKIISEGYHEYYGGPHGERNAIINCDQNELLNESTLYITLEPCNHHGKTPPCTDIILSSGIKKVVIAQLDPNTHMQGKSIELLRKAGVSVIVGVLQKEARDLNRRYIVNLDDSIPYITLKYAKSKDGYMGKSDQQVWLSNDQSNMMVHKWRSEYQGIMVGTNTAIIDNPKLNTRLYPGSSPLRIVIDRHERIPQSHHLLSDDLETWIYTYARDYTLANDHKKCVTIPEGHTDELVWILEHVAQSGISSVIIEGGRSLLSSLIKKQLWHDAYIIETPKELKTGVKSPIIEGKTHKTHQLSADKILNIRSLRLMKMLGQSMVKVPLTSVNTA